MQKLIKHIFENYPLLCFMTLHFIVWSALPMFRIGAPMDSLEAVWWGKFCLLGTNKHPPLSGFPAYAYYKIFSENLKSIYILSQTCVAAGFIFTYKLALNMLDKKKTILSVMLLEGVIFYNYCTPEYNVNVLSLALWPANAYCFYQAVTKNKTRYWLLTGLLSALNILNKYTALLQLAGIALYLILNPKARLFLKSYKPYLALAVFAILVLPHFYWLAEHDFFVIKYFSTRNQKADFSLIAHIISPLKFLTAMTLYGFGALLVFYLFFNAKLQKQSDRETREFLFCMGIIPLLLVLLYGSISGNNIKSMWGFPLLYLLGIILFSFFKAEITPRVFYRIRLAIYGLMLIFAIIYSSVLLLNSSPKYNLDTKEFAAQNTKIWQSHTSTPLKYVMGDVWLASIMALKSKDKPTPVIWGTPSRNPWVDKKDFKKSGALILAESPNEYANYANQYEKSITSPQKMIYEFKSRLGKTRNKNIYYGFYKGETKW